MARRHLAGTTLAPSPTGQTALGRSPPPFPPGAPPAWTSGPRPQTWDPEQTWDPMPLTPKSQPFLPCLSLAHAHMTYHMPQRRKFSPFRNLCHARYSLNGGIKTVPVPYLPADTARSVSSTSEYGQATSRTPSRSVCQPYHHQGGSGDCTFFANMLIGPWSPCCNLS